MGDVAIVCANTGYVVGVGQTCHNSTGGEDEKYRRVFTL